MIYIWGTFCFIFNILCFLGYLTKDFMLFFQIAVNGVHFGSFPHRMNLHHIKYINFEGAVVIDQITIYHQVDF